MEYFDQPQYVKSLIKQEKKKRLNARLDNMFAGKKPKLYLAWIFTAYLIYKAYETSFI